MRPPDLQLLTQHAAWVLQADPEAGLEALLAVQPPLPTQLAIPLLQVRVCVCAMCYVLFSGGLALHLHPTPKRTQESGEEHAWVCGCMQALNLLHTHEHTLTHALAGRHMHLITLPCTWSLH
jgi:hypothetical protein